MTDIPNKLEGIKAKVEAHIHGSEGEWKGGYFTTLTIGDSKISACLESKLKGQKLKCAAFFTRLQIADNSVLVVDLVVDATKTNKSNAATKLNSLVGTPQPKTTFTGTVAAYETNSEGGGADVLKEVNIQGQIARSTKGILNLIPLGTEEFGAHTLQTFEISILLDQSTDLQINYGGTDRGVWTIGPLTSAG